MKKKHEVVMIIRKRKEPRSRPPPVELPRDTRLLPSVVGPDVFFDA